MIEVKNLTKTFGENTVFKDLCFKIDDGEFVVFSGKSGCGKTTMLNLIGGIDTPDSGEILIDGADITKQKNRIEYFRNKVSFLFQNFALIDNKTVEENLNMVKKNTRTDTTIEQALESVGLKDKIKAKVYTLSGGEQQSRQARLTRKTRRELLRYLKSLIPRVRQLYLSPTMKNSKRQAHG